MNDQVFETVAIPADDGGSPLPTDNRGVANTSMGGPGGGMEPTMRIVYINDEARNPNFLSNYISTSKYSLLTAVPIFHFEQFSPFSNA